MSFPPPPHQKLSDDADWEPRRRSPRQRLAAAPGLAAAGLTHVAVTNLKPKQPHAGAAAAVFVKSEVVLLRKNWMIKIVVVR